MFGVSAAMAAYQAQRDILDRIAHLPPGEREAALARHREMRKIEAQALARLNRVEPGRTCDRTVVAFLLGLILGG